MKKLIALCSLLCLLPLFAAADSYTITLPDGVSTNEGLPVYRATERSQLQSPFFDSGLDYGWFDDSGIAAADMGTGHDRMDVLTFTDGALLEISPETIRYARRQGEYYFVLGEDPEHPTGPYPSDSLAVSIGRLAANGLQAAARGESDSTLPDMTLGSERLTGISLQAARAQVEALLDKLGLSGYVCETALDMNVDRIRRLGEWYTLLHAEDYNRREPAIDFAHATAADEGYYLIYRKQLDGVPLQVADGDSFRVKAFVNAEGIAWFDVHEQFIAGGVYELPERLLTAEEAVAAFIAGNEQRIRHGYENPQLVSLSLRYVPVRAAVRSEGMVLEPAYYMEYTHLDGSEAPLWAWYSAVDGRLLLDCY